MTIGLVTAKLWKSGYWHQNCGQVFINRPTPFLHVHGELLLTDMKVHLKKDYIKQ